MNNGDLQQLQNFHFNVRAGISDFLFASAYQPVGGNGGSPLEPAKFALAADTVSNMSDLFKITYKKSFE